MFIQSVFIKLKSKNHPSRADLILLKVIGPNQIDEEYRYYIYNKKS